MQPSVPIAMLLTKDVAYEWHDGVALAAQLVTQVRADIPHADGHIPDLRGVTLEESGTLALSAHPEHSMPAMPGAAQVLQQLLSGKEQPTQLRLFAMQAATAEPPMSLASFAEELEKWERPNRLAKLGALYQRAFEQIGPAALTDEAKLREARAQAAMRGPVKASAPPAAVTAKKPADATKPRGQRSHAGTTAIIIGIVMLAAAGGTWFVLSRDRSVPQRAAGTTPTGPASDDTVEPSRPSSDRASNSARPQSRAPKAAAATPSPVVASAEAELARARGLFARQEYGAAAAAFDRVLQMLGGDAGPQVEELREVARSMGDVSRAAIAEQVEAATREYRAGDQGVIEPVPLGYLPTRPDPDTPAERLQVLEVHINTSGTVDAAKFVMSRPSFRNSWWTSAAKAWRFSPATRNGQPVRFVMRIVMDDSAAR